MGEKFKCLLASREGDDVTCGVTQLDEDALPDGNVTVRIDHSTVNYKDAMAVSGNRGKILRDFPIVPGIDLAGTVEESGNDDFTAGDRVLINGFGIGETHWGGFTERSRVKSEWLIPVPARFSSWQAMAIGTAGYTAALSVLALEHAGVMPESGPVLVTGATGGVGTIAITLLAASGYEIVAATGKKEAESDYLQRLGASEIIDRREIGEAPEKPLLSERWAGAVDAVGGHTLAYIIASLKRSGAVAAAGVAAGYEVPTTVVPFALRGVTVAGIDSPWRPLDERRRAWDRLARDLPEEFLERNSVTIGLAQIKEAAKTLLAGTHRGRIVVDVNRESV